MTEDSQPTRVFISAGSNVEPEKNLVAALELLTDRLVVKAVSTVLRTQAIGRPGDPDFLNCVFEVETAMRPRALKADVLGAIERKLGRRRGADKYAARAIDLDLILYGTMVTDEEGLTLPHPDLGRRFVQVAIQELAPDLELPEPGRSLLVLKAPRGDHPAGEPMAAVTEVLRSRLR
jgi:2-amino-4-hydroxy-6-hydroxymethyldihydropteridine diphosphokinase